TTNCRNSTSSSRNRHRSIQGLMVDSRFFHNAGPMTLQQIVTLTGAVISSSGDTQPDKSRAFGNVAPLDAAGPDELSFLDNVKYIETFTQSKAGACFIKPRFAARAPKDMVLLVTEEPYYAYAMTARHFYPEPQWEPSISPQAVIAKS